MLIHVKKKEFSTSLSKKRILEKIRMGLPSGRFMADSEFFGYVTDNSFKIWKNLHYNLPPFVIVRNSFSPTVIGTVEESDNESIVKIKLRMSIPSAVVTFLIEMLAIADTVFWMGYGVLNNFGYTVVSFVLGLIFLIAFEILVYIGFTRPAERLIKRIEELLIF